MAEGSHHETIKIGENTVGFARITNSGRILSIYINTDVQRMLFLPEDSDGFDGDDD